MYNLYLVFSEEGRGASFSQGGGTEIEMITVLKEIYWLMWWRLSINSFIIRCCISRLGANICIAP